MQPIQSDAAPVSGPDLRLVIGRIEEEVIREGDSPSLLKLLAQEALWRQAGPEECLRLSRAAQMAGLFDAAVGFLEKLTREAPQQVDGWRELLDLLGLLGERERLAKALAAARGIIGEEERRRRLDAANAQAAPLAETPSAAPFERMQAREMALRRFLDLFSGREDCFARQWADRAEGKSGYVPERRPFGPADLEEHLAGRKTYGIYLMQSDARVRTAVVDVDLAQRFRQAKVSAEERRLVLRERLFIFDRIREMSERAGAKPLVEYSGGKGFHFWYFFDPPAAAAAARGFLENVRQALAGDVTAFQLEVFPKQDGLSGKGLGNLVKLPLGVHRLTGRRSYFVDCADRSTEAQLAFLKTVQAIDPERLGALASRPRAEVLPHPRAAQWAEKYPELFRLEQCCPPLGQVIAACRAGKGLSQREEKILFQTVGFADRGKSLLHKLLREQPEYNPHLVDYRLSRLRGTPLGCRRIHSLLCFAGDYCRFEAPAEYAHPLLHLGQGAAAAELAKAEKRENLAGAIDNLREAIARVERFLK
jgi:hypothetical protein